MSEFTLIPGVYRKRPVEVEAFQIWGDPHALEAAAKWCGGRVLDQADDGPLIAIDTLEGTMVADSGDWIIKGVKGEFYPCKPDIFEATYTQVGGPMAVRSGNDSDGA